MDDNTKLVPDTLKEFPELAEAQKIKTDKAKRINESFHKEFDYLTERVMKERKLETYCDLRNAVTTKYNPNIQELIGVAVENSKVSGIGVGEIESGGVKSQFFVINKDFTWTDSEGNEHTPIEISYSQSIAETGSASKYKGSSRVLLGIMGKNDRKSMGPVEEQFADIHKGKAVAEKIFERVGEIAKNSDIPANGVLRMISPSLLDKVYDIRIVGESDEFQNNSNSITIVDPTLA